MTTNNFYRRPLPKSCIDFACSEGKVLFKEALSEGFMNCYFNLAAQFRTQDEPAYCGLSTLVMVLNGLSVDPGRVWKGPWRWYHEHMLDCCIPLDIVKKKGITLSDFHCLAKCNGLDVDIKRALPSTDINDFRRAVKDVTQSENKVLVCSYSRNILGQTGGGHFSPIGGYHPTKDLVLIFDVARFKYPPHWVSVDLLWKAMQSLDKETGQPRGYLLLTRSMHSGNPTILLKIADNFNLSNISADVKKVLQHWQTWLMTECKDKLMEKKTFLLVLISKFSFLFLECVPGIEKIFAIKIDHECCGWLSQDHKNWINDLLLSLQKLNVFKLIYESLKSCENITLELWEGAEMLKIANKCILPHEDANNVKNHSLTICHISAIVLLSWPYPQKKLNETEYMGFYNIKSNYICRLSLSSLM
ncbi:glutathione gamma-glutamylcysteinyltransferase-like isoform X2 [Xenia sp. Carnegie-2017]|uniref:glutathione gamma-glutamylcysteinyltransferase-like isoform X2 n=1 Tax=Xenia sp. Carnegie-2017 TaxID=2897299 RepID=UPI001F041DBE|nr:glutathione gamma-glutamylcysteinyltransferase-like isoform X2 [Xenia sp. Carnegie-2017]